MNKTEREIERQKIIRELIAKVDLILDHLGLLDQTKGEAEGNEDER